jgi:hypothetical protein
MCLLKIPNEISNINSFATGEMFRDVTPPVSLLYKKTCRWIAD